MGGKSQTSTPIHTPTNFSMYQKNDMKNFKTQNNQDMQVTNLIFRWESFPKDEKLLNNKNSKVKAGNKQTRRNISIT